MNDQEFSQAQECGMDKSERRFMRAKESIKTGITFGTALAIAISWSANKSILWAIIHGVFSWLYVIYYALTRP
jgi:hypothetical protein